MLLVHWVCFDAPMQTAWWRGMSPDWEPDDQDFTSAIYVDKVQNTPVSL